MYKQRTRAPQWVREHAHLRLELQGLSTEDIGTGHEWVTRVLPHITKLKTLSIHFFEDGKTRYYDSALPVVLPQVMKEVESPALSFTGPKAQWLFTRQDSSIVIVVEGGQSYVWILTDKWTLNNEPPALSYDIEKQLYVAKWSGCDEVGFRTFSAVDWWLSEFHKAARDRMETAAIEKERAARDERIRRFVEAAREKRMKDAGDREWAWWR